MIDHVIVENFRCFPHLDVKDLKRINVLVGKNSSGKSAFLESLFLSSSSTAANMVFNLRAIRRIGGTLQVPADSLAYSGLWEDIFWEFDTNLKVNISVRGSQGDQRSLSVSLSSSVQQELSFGKEVKNSLGLPQAVFNWKRGGGQQITTKPQITTTGLQLGNVKVDHFPMIWFTPGSGDSAEETARRYSALSRKNQVGPVVDAIRAEFNFVEDLSIEFLAGIPMIFAALKGQSRKVPIGLVSDGIARLLAIFVGIAYYEKGAVLIDQIEDGIYYERFPSIWKSLHKFADKYQTQIFVSTHSKECIDSLAGAVKENEDSFRLLRASRADRGCTIESIPGSFLSAALEQDFEVR